MCNRSSLLYYNDLFHNIAFIILAVITSYFMCWLFTYLDLNMLPFSETLTSPYKNSEALILSLKAEVYSSNESEDFGLVKNANDLEIRNEGYSKYGFNALASRNIGIYRDIPDTRHKLCDSISYPSDLPTASIIICFFNEHYQTLLRTLYSIVRRTPKRLLKEIILVNDCSEIEDLHENIEHYISIIEELKHVHLFKTDKREGLIRARLFGADKATGDVLVFLDSHIEVNRQWLDPMLSRIAENQSSHVVTPIIDVINPDTFHYSSSPLVRGGFNWGLHFKWENIPKALLKSDEDFIKPVKSPTMAGGLFAMDRQYFNNLGRYDAQMDVWGGENLELSFRVWMCGGTLEIIPCSRVGHVFRRHRPYASPNGQDTMVKNSLRVAHVWLDQYKVHYFAAVPQTKFVKYDDVADRIALRKQLNCKSFDWYLENVYPELILPNDDEKRTKEKANLYEKPLYQRWDQRTRNYINRFMIRLAGTNLCVSSEKDIRTKGSLLILRNCLRAKHQMWYQTDKHEIILAQLLCLDIASTSDMPKLSKCHELGGSQEWKYSDFKNTAIYNLAAGTCLGVQSPNVDSYVLMKVCADSENSKWNLVTEKLNN